MKFDDIPAKMNYPGINQSGWVRNENPPDILNFEYRAPIKQSWDGADTEWVVTYITLNWTGKRWRVWMRDLYYGEMTEFTDRENPPFEWAEAIQRMVIDIPEKKLSPLEIIRKTHAAQIQASRTK